MGVSMTKSVPSYFTALFTVSIIRSQKVYTVKVLFFFSLGGSKPRKNDFTGCNDSQTDKKQRVQLKKGNKVIETIQQYSSSP